MNKLKNVFQRSSQKIKTTEDRRPQQFVKRHSSAMVTPIVTTDYSTTPLPPPAINLSELSEMEKPAYQSWWKDLDPFDLKKINNKNVLKFLNGCNLQDNKLEQILALFETAGDGLDKLQFFAMLRLIAHAQNGRKISRALVYLGAPIPQFHQNTIDILIKPTDDNNQEIKKPIDNRKSWWGNEKEQQFENRRSYMGPFTAHTPIPSQPSPIMDCFYDNNAWEQQPIRPIITNAASTTAITPITPKIIQSDEKYTHGRSRSAGTVNEFIHNPYQQVEETQLASSRSSLSLHELNTGQTLLLTQKFVYQSPSMRNQELAASNPFNIPSAPPVEPSTEDICSPFDDTNSEDQINYKPNTYSIPPPPVPNQLTKPACPKYTRTNTFLIKRSQSTAADRKPTTKSGAFFQTDAEIAKQKEKQLKYNYTEGDAIKLGSKALDILLSQDEKYIYVAESGFFVRHIGPVTAMALTHDTLWTGSWDKSVKKWDLETGECLATLEGHSDFIKSMILVGDNIYTGSSDCFLRRWNTKTLTCTAAEKKHKRTIESLAVSVDGKYIYSASSDSTVMKWDVETMKVVHTFEGHDTSVYCVRVCEDDVWTASADKTVRRWNVNTGAVDMVLNHPDRVKSLALAGPFIVTGSSDDDIRVWDIGSGKLICTIEGHFDEVGCLEISGTTLYSGSLDCSIRKWSLTTSAIKIYNETREAKLKRLEAERMEEQKKSDLTEEEERELAELMLSDDDDDE
ncbi:hypothetical protein INT48_004701 [Thamnidium elegans]|uniref:Uncharacterized protein n=1 Tax=Thamnidium elegans TaxID=101142 RepID=A0A8H7STF1_9FUNG|nr:hypothetical protein INT48_004701 [Thamnidium elegans]